MKKEIRFKGYNYDFTEVHQFIGNIDVTEAFRKRDRSIDCIISYSKMAAEEDRRCKHNESVLEELKSFCNKRYLEDIEDYLENCENTDCYSIEKDLPENFKKYKQEEYEYKFKYAYINQKEGMAGDDYSGTIYIPLPNKKYFKFEYWM